MKARTGTHAKAPAWMTARPIAHRGLHDITGGIIENSPSAAIAAIGHGFGIECDVQWTADGEAVVFHDFELDRLTTSTGRVDQLTAAAMGRLTMRGTADKIMPLAAFIGLVAGRVPLVIEIKSRFDGDLRLTHRVADIVKDSTSPIVLKSFDPVIVAALHDLTPDHARGIVAMQDYSYPDYEACTADEKRAMANLLHFTTSQPDFISWRVRDLPSAAPYLCRAALGLPVMTWTVRTPEDRALAAAHADQMVFEGFIP
jgi:glycerophosphoryl diester phosphodiesterase